MGIPSCVCVHKCVYVLGVGGWTVYGGSMVAKWHEFAMKEGCTNWL